VVTNDSGHYGDGVARLTKRLWTDEEKRSICFQTTAPGKSVAQVARRYAVNANLIFKWLRDPCYAPDPASVPSAAMEPRLLPVEIVTESKMAVAAPARGTAQPRLARQHHLSRSCKKFYHDHP
jgi:transposase